MKTQQDHKIRIVAFDNLRAMCDRASGMCHRYTVTASRSRVSVTYSNPDEYVNDCPVTAVFPCYPSAWGKEDVDNPRVVLDPIRVYGGRDEHDRDGAYQAIDASIVSAPTLWCNNETWESHAEIASRRTWGTVDEHGTCRSCVVCDVKTEGK